MKLGQNFVEYFVRFLGNGATRKIAFESYLPLLLHIVGGPGFIVIITLSQDIFFKFNAVHSLNWYFTHIY